MCSIMGIHGKFIKDDIFMMLKCLKHRGPNGFGIYTKEDVYYNTSDNIKYSDFFMAHNLLSIVGMCELQPLSYNNLSIVANAELYNYEELTDEFNFKNLTSNSDCEIILRVIESNYDGNLYDAVIKSVNFFDGDYAFCITDSVDYIVIRDMCGVKPVYYAKDDKRFAFASEKKALKQVGLDSISNLNPRCMIYNDEIIKFRSDYKKDDFYTDYNQALHDLKDALYASVKKRVKGLNRVAVLFSGGVDSSIIVKILLDLNVDVDLYTIGVENSQDLKVVRKIAQDMDLNLKEWVINQEIIENELKPTIKTIENKNIMQIGVGMTIKLTSKLAAVDNHKVILSGQGADELFAGYNRYKNKYDTPNELYDELEYDINTIYDNNLERDDKATMSNSVELRVPYLDEDVIKTALKMPIDYLLKSSDDNMRKHILRDLALEIGVSEDIALRPKKAAQYATGIDKVIRKKLLKKDEIKQLLN